MSVFLNVDDIVIIIDGCRKFQPAQMNLVEFHIYLHAIIAKRILIQKVYLKSCCVSYVRDSTWRTMI